jgi:hypothetical protein
VNGEHKITSGHRERTALIYLRQSSMAQVREHTESTRSQYALAGKAAALGWARSDIEVIDTDLGISGKWGVARKGFTELVTRVCTGQVGAIFGIEITRHDRPGPRTRRCRVPVPEDGETAPGGPRFPEMAQAIGELLAEFRQLPADGLGLETCGPIRIASPQLRLAGPVSCTSAALAGLASQ